MNIPTPDSEWFTKEILPHEGALRAFLISHYPTLSDVDDLVQDSYRKVLNAHATGPVPSPRGLLFSVAKNIATDILRRRKIINFESITEDSGSSVYIDTANVSETVSKKEELELLTEAIQLLPDRCRQVFTLRTVYGMSQRDIAEKMGISENTVEKQIGKGIRRCGDFFKSHGLA